MLSNTKLRVLAIHGYRQSDEIFSAKLGSLRKSFKREIEFTFVRAPHKVSPVKNCDNEIENVNNAQQYGWWFNTEDRVFQAIVPSNLSVGFEDSIQLIKNIFKEKGPFDGLIGFSQGGSFVSLLCVMQQRNILPIKFNFAIIISGFKSLCKPHELYYSENLTLPILHVYGANDKVIPTNMSEDLNNMFENKDTFIHEGGHFVPGKKQIFNEFITRMLEIKKGNQ
ncbi:esterase OVCA2 [Copidosoma floridanum]|uniref:esterase OVCA2 n=1 Tax=Copidosoma floridanum TaxID=29053 RepID=UPI0006C9DD99|nr:esterase OVCA2 [Copidosoma floridanum]